MHRERSPLLDTSLSWLWMLIMESKEFILTSLELLLWFIQPLILCESDKKPWHELLHESMMDIWWPECVHGHQYIDNCSVKSTWRNPLGFCIVFTIQCIALYNAFCWYIKKPAKKRDFETFLFRKEKMIMLLFTRNCYAEIWLTH